MLCKWIYLFIYCIHQNIWGWKPSRFINNVHYVGKTFAVCSLEASACLCNVEACRSLQCASTYCTFFQWILWKVFRKLSISIKNSVINSISCYNSLLFRQNLQIRMTLGRITQNCCHFLVGLSMAELLKCWFNEPEGSGSSGPHFSILKYFNRPWSRFFLHMICPVLFVVLSSLCF